MKHLSQVADAIFITRTAEMREANLVDMCKQLGTETKNIRLIADKAEQDRRLKKLASVSGINVEILKLYV